jgi:hypothetical protein
MERKMVFFPFLIVVLNFRDLANIASFNGKDNLCEENKSLQALFR